MGNKPFARRKDVWDGRMAFLDSVKWPPPWIMSAIDNGTCQLTYFRDELASYRVPMGIASEGGSSGMNMSARMWMPSTSL